MFFQDVAIISLQNFLYFVDLSNILKITVHLFSFSFIYSNKLARFPDASVVFNTPRVFSLSHISSLSISDFSFYIVLFVIIFPCLKQGKMITSTIFFCSIPVINQLARTSSLSLQVYSSWWVANETGKILGPFCRSGIYLALFTRHFFKRQVISEM